MNNELFNHQKSDAVKWVCTLLAFLIVGVLIAGIICGWFDKKETPPTEQTETGFIVTPDEMSGVSLSVKAMSANGNEVNALAENSYTVTATIQPATALQRANWSVAWKNGSSARADDSGGICGLCAREYCPCRRKFGKQFRRYRRNGRFVGIRPVAIRLRQKRKYSVRNARGILLFGKRAEYGKLCSVCVYLQPRAACDLGAARREYRQYGNRV